MDFDRSLTPFDTDVTSLAIYFHNRIAAAYFAARLLLADTLSCTVVFVAGGLGVCLPSCDLSITGFERIMSIREVCQLRLLFGVRFLRLSIVFKSLKRCSIRLAHVAFCLASLLPSMSPGCTRSRRVSSNS